MEEERGDGEGRSLMEVFATVPDPRDAHGLRHPLGAILVVCLPNGFTIRQRSTWPPGLPPLPMGED